MKRYTFLLVGVLLALVALVGGAAAEPAAPETMNEKIVFSRGSAEYRGDIYMMNPDGSNQTRLTASSADERYPAFSPDGTKIAFTRDGRVFVMDADGSNAIQLTYDYGSFDPCWSPDGLKIAFTNWTGFFVMNSDGSDLKQLSREFVAMCSWSPDGTRIAFALNGDIMIMDPDGENITNLTNNRSTDVEPDWSPDGKKLVYERQLLPGNTEIFVINADGTGRTRLTFRNGLDSRPAWSPDGTKIVFASSQSDLSDLHDTAISVMDADGGNKVNLTSLPINDSSPDWQVAYGSDGPRIFMPTDDTYVVETPLDPDATFGRKTFLKIRNTRSDLRAFLKFRVSSLEEVEEATLRLFVRDAGPVGSLYSASPYFLNTNTYWTEQELNWNNAPLLTGEALAEFYPLRRSRWVEMDVTDAVQAAIDTGSEYVSFAVSTSSTNLVAFASKDGLRRPPQLVVITK